jgi:hypothetical protein
MLVATLVSVAAAGRPDDLSAGSARARQHVGAEAGACAGFGPGRAAPERA